MRIEKLKGEFFFRALGRDAIGGEGWVLSRKFYSSREEVIADWGEKTEFRWPAEEMGESTVFVPDPEELKDE